MTNKIQKQVETSNKSQFFGTRKEIISWLDKCCIENYTINDDLSVDVKGSLDLSYKNLKIFPIKFGNVTGDFWCNGSQLISLIGSPETVGRSFWCSSNKLTSLIGSPKTVGEHFGCVYNNLTSFTGSPKSVGGDFYCVGNKIISLIEIIDCDFKKNIYFSIDENNFKQKELTPILKKYYDSKSGHSQLTNHQFHDIIKPFLEKEILKNKLSKSKIKIQAKTSFL